MVNRFSKRAWAKKDGWSHRKFASVQPTMAKAAAAKSRCVLLRLFLCSTATPSATSSAETTSTIASWTGSMRALRFG